MTEPDQVIRHYGLEDLRERLAAALRTAGLEDTTLLSPEDLAPLDQFHTRGLAATIELAKSVGIKRDAEVLDIGSGLGGPSRYLAATYGCHVRGVDLSQAYVTAATYLAERAGLTDRVTYQRADAMRLPFGAERFDIAWTQHVAMNIADRAAFYAEAFRVLRRGGRLAIYDVVQGEGGPPPFPVPWSRSPATSFLLTADAMQRALEAQGFQRVTWADKNRRKYSMVRRAAENALTRGTVFAWTARRHGTGVSNHGRQSQSERTRAPHRHSRSGI